jgi:hypothetical protein
VGVFWRSKSLQAERNKKPRPNGRGFSHSHFKPAA